jgi:hypothetical protein
MESSSKAIIVAAVVTALGGIVAALIDWRPDTTVPTCDPIPAVEKLTPPPREGFVWVPTDFKLSSGHLEPVQGHWKRRNADGKNKYIPGHWETVTGQCVWVPGTFVAG